MSSRPEETQLYFSDLAREPQLAELVELFVAELPSRLAAMERAAAAQDWQELNSLAHQLKGAGGSYGFPQLAKAAEGIERIARSGGVQGDAATALDRLAVVISLTRAGTPCGGTGQPQVDPLTA